MKGHGPWIGAISLTLPSLKDIELVGRENGSFILEAGVDGFWTDI